MDEREVREVLTEMLLNDDEGYSPAASATCGPSARTA
jgi:hypothetical protein